MSRPRGHPDNTLISSLANDVRWAAVDDRPAATAPAREAFNDTFVRQAREQFGDDLARRAEHLRRAHYKRLALRSAQARRKRARTPDDREAAAA